MNYNLLNLKVAEFAFTNAKITRSASIS